MFPSRLSLHFALKHVEQNIMRTLHLQVVEQVVIRQKFTAVGRASPPPEILSLCRNSTGYTVVDSLGEDLTVLNSTQLSELMATLSERDIFPAQRYLSVLNKSPQH
jgi:hypothetical protein